MAAPKAERTLARLLARVYAGFAEGFDTPDLREARRELDAMGGLRLPVQPAQGNGTPEAGQGEVPQGPHRRVPPEETLARLAPHLARMGITRVANITGLDRVGVPVVTVVRPNARSLAVSQGKGLTLAAAKVSAIMEAAELYHAEPFQGPLWWARPARARRPAPVRGPLALPRSLPARAMTGPIAWIEGEDLRPRRQDPGPVRLRQRRLYASRPSAFGARARRHHRRARRRQRPRRGRCCRAWPS